jgi:hypothetical protein
LRFGMGAIGVSARLTNVRSVSGVSRSLAGGTIDHRIIILAGRAEERRTGSRRDGRFSASPRGARRETL